METGSKEPLKISSDPLSTRQREPNGPSKVSPGLTREPTPPASIQATDAGRVANATRCRTPNRQVCPAGLLRESNRSHGGDALMAAVTPDRLAAVSSASAAMRAGLRHVAGCRRLLGVAGIRDQACSPSTASVAASFIDRAPGDVCFWHFLRQAERVRGLLFSGEEQS
jgi:uncharacterized membrane protein